MSNGIVSRTRPLRGRHRRRWMTRSVASCRTKLVRTRRGTSRSSRTSKAIRTRTFSRPLRRATRSSRWPRLASVLPLLLALAGPLCRPVRPPLPPGAVDGGVSGSEAGAVPSARPASLSPCPIAGDTAAAQRLALTNGEGRELDALTLLAGDAAPCMPCTRMSTDEEMVDTDIPLDDASARQKSPSYWIRVCEPQQGWLCLPYLSRQVGFARACAKRTAAVVGQQLTAPHVYNFNNCDNIVVY